jgi:hypothetical protein
MFRVKLKYKERVKWFVSNYYESGMEFGAIYSYLKDKDLDGFFYLNRFIVIPKYKDEL